MRIVNPAAPIWDGISTLGIMGCSPSTGDFAIIHSSSLVGG